MMALIIKQVWCDVILDVMLTSWVRKTVWIYTCTQKGLPNSLSQSATQGLQQGLLVYKDACTLEFVFA